jgi:hypothetical protein
MTQHTEESSNVIPPKEVHTKADNNQITNNELQSKHLNNSKKKTPQL